MEEIHGVDVGWLHRKNKGDGKFKVPSPKALSRDPTPPPAPEKLENNHHHHSHLIQTVSSPNDASQAPDNPPPQASKSPPKRPIILGRSASEKLATNGDSKEDGRFSRRQSWISSLSSKFSSEKSMEKPNGATANGNAKAQSSGVPAAPAPIPAKASNVPSKPIPIGQSEDEAVEDDDAPYVPQQPRNAPGFFSSAFRRLSSSAPQGMPKPSLTGGVCPRMILNKDLERERPSIKELSDSRLRRVAFSVDVEIAGRAAQPLADDNDDEPDKSKKKKHKDKKIKERAEGEALKHPEAFKNDNDEDETEKMRSIPNVPSQLHQAFAVFDDEHPAQPKDDDEERKTRKDKKRRKQEESGTVPKEIAQEVSSNPPTHATHDKPTMDPVRVYRRCCQLREAPVLKRISEQLSNPDVSLGHTPGVVGALDLRGSRMQLTDVNVLGDWLAIVPVKKLLVDDANLSDEGLRMILAGLLATRPVDLTRRKRNKSSPNRVREKIERRPRGVVEKLSLKNNPKITKTGWQYLTVFLNMSRSIKCLDVSLITFPERKAPLTSQGSEPEKTQSVDMAELLCKAMANRLAGPTFEELIMGECHLTSYDVGKIVDAAIESGIKRLGLAGNHLDKEGVRHAARFIQSTNGCSGHGLDLGGNDLRDHIDLIYNALTPDVEICALCFADCNLNPACLSQLLAALVLLPNLRLLDISHNHDIFSSQPSAVGTLRKYIPKLSMLRRLHLIDVSMTPAQAIGIAEVLPEGRNLNHVTFLENPALIALVNATDEPSQEDACALYASLMAAARVSKTILALDIEPPGPDTNDVVKALAKQVVAYCLRNMERYTAAEAVKFADSASKIPDFQDEEGYVETPDILIHLVGHSEGDSGPHDNDPPAPDDDYIVAGQGVVKALSYCFGENTSDLRRVSTFGLSDSTSAMQMKESDAGKAKALQVSKNLLGSARKIRIRLRLALMQEAKSGDELAYKRLLFLDNTLKGMIERFEEEYPNTREIPDSPSVDTAANTKDDNAGATEAVAEGSVDDVEDDEDEERPLIESRRASDVASASRVLGAEEGRMHRMGQRIRRSILRPQGLDHAHGTTNEDPSEPEHLAALRQKIEEIAGEELRDKVLNNGYEETVNEFIDDAEALAHLQENYPEEFEKLREAQLAAQANGSGENVDPI